jgi:hypothetical protein
MRKAFRVTAGTAVTGGESHRGDRHTHDLADLARRVWRLAPDRRDPEHFHIERDEIARALLALADDRRG